MRGFLTDPIRDAIALVGFGLAILQTWVAIKSARRAPDVGTPSPATTPSDRRQIVGCTAFVLVTSLGIPSALAYLGAAGYVESRPIWVVVARCSIALGIGTIVAIGYNYHEEASVTASRPIRLAILTAVHGSAIALLVAASMAMLWVSHQSTRRLDVVVAETFSFVVIGIAICLPMILLMEHFNFEL